MKKKTNPRLIHVNLVSVRTVLANSGSSMISVGSGSGDKCAIQAANQAINSIDPSQLACASNALIVLKSDKNMRMKEFWEGVDSVRAAINDNANIVVGMEIIEPISWNNESRASIMIRLAGIPIPPDEKPDQESNTMKKKTNFNFDRADKMIAYAITACTDLCFKPGLIRVDFADVRTVLADSGSAVMGIGSGSGDKGAIQAVNQAINSITPSQLACASGALVVLNADQYLTTSKFSDVGHIVREVANGEANVVVGTAINPSLDNEFQVTIIAAGLRQY